MQALKELINSEKPTFADLYNFLDSKEIFVTIIADILYKPDEPKSLFYIYEISSDLCQVESEHFTNRKECELKAFKKAFSIYKQMYICD